MDHVTDREPGARDEDELWRSIVDNYGDRAELPDDEPTAARPPEPAASSSEDTEPDPDRFVAPDPPMAPLPHGLRLVAWLGVLLAPLVMLAAAMAIFSLPRLVGLLLVGWFVGGFGYLVATMPRGPRDPGDDGAVV